MEITNYKKNTNPNSVMKASFTLLVSAADLAKLGPMSLECNYFQKPEGEHWVNYCSKEYTSKEGKKKYWNMAKWEKANAQEMKDAIKEMLTSMDADVAGDLPF